jgi:hypothetical protein
MILAGRHLLRFDSRSNWPVCSSGALDAFDVTAAILRRRASQQAFNGLRFQMETVPLIRWMSEPTEPGERQERAYRVLCGQITRYAKFLLEDAGRDRDALQGVHAVRRWGERLREIAKQDGIEHLQRELGRRELFDKYFPKSGYPMFSMYSELGSHPGAFGNLLFSLRPESREINYDLGQALVARAFWSSAALVFLWQTCEAIAKALGWDDWLREVVPIFNAAGPLMSETARRRNALMYKLRISTRKLDQRVQHRRVLRRQPETLEEIVVEQHPVVRECSRMSLEGRNREGRRVSKLSREGPCIRGQRSSLEGIPPFRLGRYHAQFLSRAESEPTVVLRRAEQDDQRHARSVSGGQECVHQGAPDARTLMIRKYADRPHGNNVIGRNSCVARRNVADHPAVGQCRERKRGDHVARLPQRLEQADLRGERTRALRPPKPRPPKRLGVDVPNRLVIVGLLLSNDHPAHPHTTRDPSPVRAFVNVPGSPVS